MKAFRAVSNWLELWLVWISVTAISWAGGLVMAVVIVKIASLASPGAASLVMGGVMVGALIGLAQWAILRPGARSLGAWTVAASLGWTAALVITASALRTMGISWGGLVGGALGGLVWGVAQWPALRPETGERVTWTLATALGWTAAVALGRALRFEGDLAAVGGGAVQVAVIGLWGMIIIGMVATLALPLLFPEPHQRAVERRVDWWWF
jgi:hypothetical protein